MPPSISVVNMQSNIVITGNGVNALYVNNGSPYEPIIEQIQDCLDSFPPGTLSQFARQFALYYEQQRKKLSAKERKKVSLLIELFEALEEVEP